MRRGAWIAAAFLLASAVTIAAQKTTNVHPGKGGSPHVRTEWVIDGANLSIEYGRPYLKGRQDSEVMPAGSVWRTGADEATTLKTDKALRFGTLTVPAGTYTLWTIPGAAGWQLVISKQTGQWGTAYQEKEDLGRVPMTVAKAPKPVEQLTISIDDTAQGATLRIEWGTTRATAAFVVQ
jgi:hypothetical protein